MFIKVKMFGFLRDINRGQPDLTLNLDEGATPADVRGALSNYFSASGFPANQHLVTRISECAFADETEIINDQVVLKPDSVLSILPPVSGG